MSNVIEQVRSLLRDGRQIRIELPKGGRLHIDRRLPFLCVYRRLPGTNDSGTETLVVGEASYLIASGEKRFASDLSRLVRTIVHDLSNEFGAFLVVEILSDAQTENTPKNGWAGTGPGFRILTSRSRSAAQTVEALAYALRSIRILKRRSTVEMVYTNKRFATSLPHLISPKEGTAVNCFTIGLEVRPVYRDPETGSVYPLVLRDMHRGVARSLKKAFFEFSRSQTSHRAVTYQALGQRAVVKAVWEADRRLAEISTSFDFLLQVTPTNVDSAWNWFRRSGFTRVPVLHYRPRPVDPTDLKRRLYQVRLDRIEDPTLASVFREKQQEVDRQLTMLGDRGTRNFLYGSLQLFGGVSAD
ncbi:MAG TPA: tyrosine/phenylalanine carboxypeptidase domain-containing protein, partial [Acidobacteriota bacterium]|nr:tyrosine/phenylalanine carboxypeptidase domain-containing protein [Acidobacteriota bacterium]